MNRLNSGRDTPRVQWLDQGREHPHRIALSCEVSAVEEVMGRLADQITKRGVLVSGAGAGGEARGGGACMCCFEYKSMHGGGCCAACEAANMCTCV
jgi:hypothetical protein